MENLDLFGGIGRATGLSNYVHIGDTLGRHAKDERASTANKLTAGRLIIPRIYRLLFARPKGDLKLPAEVQPTPDLRTNANHSAKLAVFFPPQAPNRLG